MGKCKCGYDIHTIKYSNTTISTDIGVDRFPQEERVNVNCPVCNELLEAPVTAVIALICTKCGHLFNGWKGTEYQKHS